MNEKLPAKAGTFLLLLLLFVSFRQSTSRDVHHSGNYFSLPPHGCVGLMGHIRVAQKLMS